MSLDMTFIKPATLLIAVACMALVASVFVAPIPQDPAYHLFADTRGLLSIVNFGDVASNLPFLFIGIAGVFLALNRKNQLQACWPAYLMFFIGVGLTAFGSGYYHLAPGNDTLLWDRLPMTIAFMPLFSIVISDFVSPSAGRRLLLPLLLAGVGSVVYWHWTESIGAGDLRPYALVQFLPMLLMPLMLVLFKSDGANKAMYWWMIAFYALAKVLEFYDPQVFAATGIVSGHTLKHLAAAGAPLLFLLGARRRFGRPAVET